MLVFFVFFLVNNLFCAKIVLQIQMSSGLQLSQQNHCLKIEIKINWNNSGSFKQEATS